VTVKSTQLLSAFVLFACVKRAPDSAVPSGPGAPQTVGNAPQATPTQASHCSASGRLFDGGRTLIMQDGASIWYKVSGNDRGAVLYFFHGGPGYNSYTFEKSVGALLEREFRVVYIDQRGTGRSAVEASAKEGDSSVGVNYGMARTINDIERIRATLGDTRIGLIGHSFGGAVAAEYAHRYPERITGVAFVETATDMNAAVTQQVALVTANAQTLFPQEAPALIAIGADSNRHPLDRLTGFYGVVPRLKLQRALDFATQEGQDKQESLDALSGLSGCTRKEVVAAFRNEGYFDRELPTVAFSIPARSGLIIGRYSHVIGENGYRHAAAVWGATPVIFEKSGHFPYVEESEAFAAQMHALFAGVR
jgi:proline iminopeptidase